MSACWFSVFAVHFVGAVVAVVAIAIILLKILVNVLFYLLVTQRALKYMVLQ